jgi:hypothetical protein
VRRDHNGRPEMRISEFRPSAVSFVDGQHQACGGPWRPEQTRDGRCPACAKPLTGGRPMVLCPDGCGRWAYVVRGVLKAHAAPHQGHCPGRSSCEVTRQARCSGSGQRIVVDLTRNEHLALLFKVRARCRRPPPHTGARGAAGAGAVGSVPHGRGGGVIVMIDVDLESRGSTETQRCVRMLAGVRLAWRWLARWCGWRRYPDRMSTAYAVEYEVPAEDTRLAEILDSATGGAVVYLTRDGRRVGAVESADTRLVRLRQAAEHARRNEEQLGRIVDAVWSTADAATRALMDQALETAEDLADLAAAEASLASPAPAVDLDELLARDADWSADDDVDGQ